MERFIKVEIFQKKVIPFELLPFSCSYGNYRNFLYRYYHQMLLVIFGTENRNRIELYHLQNTCKLFTFS